MMIYDDLKNFKCDPCGKFYKGKRSLFEHNKWVHGEQKMYTCNACGKSYKRRNSLYFHEKSVHEGLHNFYCELCNKALATMDSVKAHKLTVHAKICVCSFCGKPYKNKYILKTHTNSVHKGKNVIDDSSDVKINQFENDDEKKTENSQPLFELKYVQTKEAKNNTTSIRESNSPTKHSGDLVDNVAVPYDICNESFENMDELNKNIEKGHKVAKEELEEKNPQKKSQHMKRVHKGLKKFHISSTHRNDSMGNDFYRNGHANTDDFVTKGLKKLVKRGVVIPILKFKDNELDTCIKCKKKFKFKRNFQIHNKFICGQEKRVHEGVKAERIYKCTQCEKSYTHSHKLKTHIERVHKEVKAKRVFKCEDQGLCTQSFTKAHNLKAHIKIVHQGLKKYSCKLCAKTFPFPHTLRAHIKIVHGRVKEYSSTLRDKNQQDPDITLDETPSGLSNEDIQISSQHESKSHIQNYQDVHEGKIVVSENIDRNLVHEDMKTETNHELISTSDELMTSSHNNVKIDHEDKFQGSCQYCGWSGANSELMLVIHTKNFHQEEIDLDKAFEAEVKAGLVEPLDC